MTEPAAPPTGTDAIQASANNLASEAAALANQVVDLGEEAVGTVLAAVISANASLGKILTVLHGKVGG